MSEKDADSPEIDALEDDFNQVMSGLLSDENIGRFAAQYKALLDGFVESHKNNTALIEKCRTLNAEIVSNSTKIASVLKLSQDDQRTIAGLKFEFEKAWKMVEMSQEKESKSKEIIDLMKDEIQKLSKVAEKGSSQQFLQENSLEAIAEQMKSLKREIDIQSQQIAQLSADNDNWRAKADNLRQISNEYSEEIETSGAELASLKAKTAEIDKEVRNCFDQQAEVKSTMLQNKNVIDAFDGNRNEIVQKIEYYVNKKETLRQCIRDETEQKNNELARIEVSKQTLKSKVQQNEKLLNEMKEIRKLITNTEEDLLALKPITDGSNEEKQTVEKNLKEIMSEKNCLAKQIDEARGRIAQCRTEIFRLQHEFVRAEAENNYMKREISMGQHIHSIAKADVLVEKKNLLSEEHALANVYTDISATKGKRHDIQIKCENLIKEISYYAEIASQFKSSLSAIEITLKAANEDLMLNEIKLNETQDDISKYSTQIKSLIEERDLVRRQVEGLRSEGKVIGEENILLMNEIQAGKEVIRVKDCECITVHKQREEIDEILPEQIKKKAELEKDLRSITTLISTKYNELIRTRYFRDVAESNLKEVKSVVHSISSNTKIVETRNNKIVNEVNILKEKCNDVKWKILSSAGQYNKAVENVSNLKQALIIEVQKTKDLINKGQHKQMIFNDYIHTQKALLLLQGRARALEDELETPMNIHRWRFLEGTNSEHMNLIRMTQSLRNTYMVKISNSERCKNELIEVTKEFEKMKKRIKMETQQENESQIEFYNNILQNKSNQLKVIEKNVCEQGGVLGEGKTSVDEVRSSLNDVKQEFFVLKKQTEEIRASSRNAPTVTKLLPNVKPKYIAGGFLTSATKAIIPKKSISHNDMSLSALRSSVLSVTNPKVKAVAPISQANHLPPLKPILV